MGWIFYKISIPIISKLPYDKYNVYWTEWDARNAHLDSLFSLIEYKKVDGRTFHIITFPFNTIDYGGIFLYALGQLFFAKALKLFMIVYKGDCNSGKSMFWHILGS